MYSALSRGYVSPRAPGYTDEHNFCGRRGSAVVAPNRAPTAGNGQNLLTPLDKNRDSKVSLDEYRAPILVRFDQMDSNKDGQLSPAERQAATQTASRR